LADDSFSPPKTPWKGQNDVSKEVVTLIDGRKQNTGTCSEQVKNSHWHSQQRRQPLLPLLQFKVAFLASELARNRLATTPSKLNKMYET